MNEEQLELFEQDTNIILPRAHVYIDIQNVFFRYRKLNWKVLKQFLSTKFNVKRITAYMSYMSENQKQLSFISYLSTNGYRVKACDTKINTNIDSMLITDMLFEGLYSTFLKDRFDSVVLLGNDNDYSYPLDKLSILGYDINVLGTKGNVGQEMLRIADNVEYLENIEGLELV